MLAKWFVFKNRSATLTEILFPLAIKYNIKSIFSNTEVYKLENQENHGEIIVELNPQERVVNVTPEIVNLGVHSSKLMFTLPPRIIKKYKDVYVRPDSSFIYFKSNSDQFFIIEKLKYPTNIKSLIAERRLAVNDLNWTFVKPINTIEVKNAVSFAGHYSNHFGHFILEYLEKFEHLRKLPIPIEKLTVLAQEEMDINIVELINEKQKELGFSILKVPNDTQIYAETFFTIDPINIVTDGAYYCSATDKIFRTESQKYFSAFQAPPLFGNGSKLFLIRNGHRNLTNYEEVKQLFLKHNYKLIDPSKLSIRQKREIFSNASYIVGPASSGFFNCIWCPIDAKILAFINYEISYDNWSQNMLDNNTEIIFMAGKELNYQFYQSDYYIDTKDIETISQKYKYIQ